ncbi:MAG TPA: hypothetical protein VKT49_12310 [Bryobacteraceae bacterium]|nr:hypothetical protein [Bryobacteraceae bacterium]
MSSRVQCLAAAVALAVGAAAAPSSVPAVARSQDFEVYAQAGADDARTALLAFESLHQYFSRQTWLPPSESSPVRVIVFRSHADYAPYQLRPAADAYYVGSESRNIIAMSAPRDGDIHVAAHEYAHFLLRANKFELPPWLNEGLSEVFAAVRLSGAEKTPAGDLPIRARVLRRRAWMPLEELITLPADSPVRGRPDAAEMFYAESWAFADMLTQAPDYRPRFPELISALRAGTASPRALAGVYGKALPAISADLRTWVEKRRITLASLPMINPDRLKMRISELPPALWRSVLADLLLMTGKFDRAENEYQELARDYPQNPDFPAALATIAIHGKNWAGARRNWQQALDLGFQDAGACYRYAQLANEAGLPAADIGPALERAVALRPDFDDAHYLLAHLDNNAGQYESAVTHLKSMHTVTPARQFAYWTALSYALDELGRHDEAKLAAIQASNHATTPEERERALQLARIADTELNVQFARDRNGKSLLVTTRVPRDEQNWNPFIEPEDHIRRADGKLRIVNCEGAKTSIVLETSAGSLTLTITDPSRVQMRNAPAEFTCGPQQGNAVRVIYAAGDRQDGADGVVRGIEFP